MWRNLPQSRQIKGSLDAVGGSVFLKATDVLFWGCNQCQQ
jgi:hypothetical protein